MKTKQLNEMGFSPIAGTGDRDIEGGFCGDLLSWAMGRAKSGDCWFTVMGNLNTVAVATLVEVAAVVLCHGVTLPAQALEKAIEEGVDVFYTDLSVFAAATRFYSFFHNERQQ